MNIGDKFYKLTITKQINNKKFEVRCDCGNICTVYYSQLATGGKKSCGCLMKEVLLKRNTTHGLSHLPEYSHWKEMMKRVKGKGDRKCYENIEYSNELLDFKFWLDHIGNKPNDGQRWSIGRIDGRKGYILGNIRWETDIQQARNHSKQSNNTSGTVGIQERHRITNGKEYFTIIGCVCVDGKKISKEFSVNKYGYEKAKELAIEYRNNMIKIYNIDFAESHGFDTKEFYDE